MNLELRPVILSVPPLLKQKLALKKRKRKRDQWMTKKKISLSCCKGLKIRTAVNLNIQQVIMVLPTSVTYTSLDNHVICCAYGYWYYVFCT